MTSENCAVDGGSAAQQSGGCADAKFLEMEHRFVAGEEQALCEVIEQYGLLLLRYCHGVLCDYHEAQDAVQATFIKAYEKRGKYQPGTSLSAWLYRIAYTTCLDLLRRQKLRFRTANLTVDIQNTASWDEEESETSVRLRGALRTLTAKERALLFSRADQNIPYETLERIHHVPAATLRKRYERAKKKLAAALLSYDENVAKKEGQK